ncbi:MAG: energy transducer TonB, partial [Rhodospirillaceae bacterium]|nr:energy transducer TonB [Rhodospirillaceae bacterium]
MDRNTVTRRALMLAGASAATLALLSGCDNPEREIASLKAQVQVAYGEKNFKDVAALAEQGYTLALKAKGPKSGDTLYFAQSLSEGYTEQGNKRAALAALDREIELRLAAGQGERKLQARRTLAIKFAEETGDKAAAVRHALAIAQDIGMERGKDPQPVYRTETAYPPEQFRRAVEGDVTIEYALDATGAVTDARVVDATPPSVFDAAALASFRDWRFTPMLDGGRPVDSRGHRFTLMFRLGGRNLA